MDELKKMTKIFSLFEDKSKLSSHPMHHQHVLHILNELFSDAIIEKTESKNVSHHIQEILANQTPLIKVNFEKGSYHLSFYCLFKFRNNGFKFFLEMITRFLLPGQKLDVVLMFATDIHPVKNSALTYTIAEAALRIQSDEEMNLIQKNFYALETELKLGLESAYYARRILELKGLSSDEKTVMIQEHIAYLAKRLPKYFTPDVFAEMQHVLLTCPDSFKAIRNYRHLSRIISVKHLFRNALLKCAKNIPFRRNVSLKLFKEILYEPSAQKSILSLIIGINFYNEQEILDEQHLVKAVKELLPHVQLVDHSFLSNRRGAEHVSTFYLEIEKPDGACFNREEILLLQKKLPKELKNHIGKLMPPVFMPRNEEEVMRNILSLSDQIKYLRDIPQVFITFDEQTTASLFFTIIVVRILNGEEKPIQELFKIRNSFLKFIPDRTRIIGHLRKKHPKEATVFRVKLPKEPFLRGDQSIDLYKARQAVVNELSRVIGEFRDFNGGMIAKQSELLCEVKQSLQNEGIQCNEILLENFFYSLSPVIMRTILEPHAFQTLFQMLLESQDKAIPQSQPFLLKSRSDEDFIFILIMTHARNFFEELNRAIAKMQLSSSELAQGYLKSQDISFIGYIYRTGDVQKQRQFKESITQTVETCHTEEIRYALG